MSVMDGTLLRRQLKVVLDALRSIAILAVVAIAAGWSERGSRSAQGRDTGFVAVPFGHIFYEAVGTGPTVVLIHGGNLDRRMWDQQVAVLALHFRVIRYDLRGFGRSTPADTPYQAQTDLYELLQHLAVHRASLSGLSLGGR